MQRLALAALALSACGTTDDQRPQNLDYITEAILAPNCGGPTCHSQFRQEKGYVFDNIEGARNSFRSDPQLIGAANLDDPELVPGLVLNLTLEQPGAPRMPYSYPIPDVDVALIKAWLQHGAPGVCTTGSHGCLGDYVVRCGKVVTHKAAPGRDPVTEEGAFNLDDLKNLTNPVKVRNCALENLTCVNGDCQ